MTRNNSITPGLPSDYSLFFSFIEKYIHNGFKDINRQDTLIQQIEQMTEQSEQFCIIADMIQMKFIFASNRCSQMIGIDPEQVNPYHFFEATHPDDIQRHSLGRSIMFKEAQDFFVAQKGAGLLSSNLRIRNHTGKYTNILFQCYMFYSTVPYPTVYLMQIHTDISWYTKIKYGYHYYIGNDFKNFRYPDDELLSIGPIFSDREFAVLQLLAKGYSSSQIADQLFLSVLTVNTHRRNIMQKSEKSTISEVLYELRQSGLLY